jgi:hypothetical protein
MAVLSPAGARLSESLQQVSWWQPDSCCDHLVLFIRISASMTSAIHRGASRLAGQGMLSCW